MKWKHKKIYLPLLILAAVVMTIGAIPLTRLLLQPEFRLRLADWVERAGPWGVVGLFCLQVLQVIVAFLPGEPMELAARCSLRHRRRSAAVSGGSGNRYYRHLSHCAAPRQGAGTAQQHRTQIG